MRSYFKKITAPAKKTEINGCGDPFPLTRWHPLSVKGSGGRSDGIVRLRTTGHRVCLCVCFYIFFPVVLPAYSEPRPLTQFLNNFSQTVGLLRRVISLSQVLYLNTGQHKHRINAYTHQNPCLEWDSNPQSHCSSDRRYTARLL